MRIYHLDMSRLIGGGANLLPTALPTDFGLSRSRGAEKIIISFIINMRIFLGSGVVRHIKY